MQLFVTGPTWRMGWMPARSNTENRRQGNLRRFSVSMDKADKKQPRTFWKARGCFCFTGSSLPQGGQARREK